MLRSRSFTFRHQGGVTLVELIIAIVIIGIAAVGILQGLGTQTVRNVDPMIQSQAQSVARQFLQEVLSKPYFDPSADPRLNPALTQTQINDSIRNQDRTGSPSRVAWDNIYEYAGYSDSVRDQNGTPDPDLSSFTVRIAVDISTSVSLGTLSNSAAANCPPQLARVDVSVTDPRGQATVVSGYRAAYWNPGC